MKHILLIAIGLLFGLSVNAQTIINDKDYVSGVWKKSKSPYIIRGEAIIAEGKSLKIKPGVMVKFKTGDERDYPGSDVGFLRVKGTLIAEGNENKMIIFTREGEFGNWGVIQIDSRSKDSKLRYCKIEHSMFIRTIVADDNATGAVSVYNSYIEISNCLFVNGWVGVNCKKNADPLMKNNIFANNQYGLECNSASSPTLLNCIIWNNKTALYVNGESKPMMSYSLINENPAKYGVADDGTNLIGLDPKFSSEENGDYTLSSGSPCKGKGKNGVDIGAY